MQNTLTSMTILKGGVFLLVSLLLIGSIPVAKGDPTKGTIIVSESCDTFDSTKWCFLWNRPLVQDGTWVFDFPTYQSKNVAAQLKTDSGYGIYTIRFRTNGPRVPGVNYSPFLYNATIPEPNHQELDMIEIFGGNTPPESPINQMSISSYNGNPLQHEYEFWNNPFNWEDGNWHIFECNFTAQQITIKMDGIISHISYEGQRYGQPNNPWFAHPPMYFQMYAGSKGNNPSHFQLIIDSIEIKNHPVNNPDGITLSAISVSQSNPVDTTRGIGWENFTCEMTDTSHQVLLNILYPTGTSSEYLMKNIRGTDTYFYNTTFTQHGTYRYSMRINDRSDTAQTYMLTITPNWDINKDGNCNIQDFFLVSDHYGQEGNPGWIREDVDNNGEIQLLDFIYLTVYYAFSWWM